MRQMLLHLVGEVMNIDDCAFDSRVPANRSNTWSMSGLPATFTRVSALCP